MTMPEEVEVTQEDREAAAELAVETAGVVTWKDEYARQVLTGERDSNRVVKAFARHRQAAIQKARADALGETQRCPACHVEFQTVNDVDAHIRSLKGEPVN